MKAFLILATTTAAVILATPLQAASFSCNEPPTTAERTICADPGLNILDDRLTYWYDRARSRAQNFDRTDGWLVSRQRAWLGERNSREADVSCLRAKYQDRIRRLRVYAEHV